mgnify:CR=1 FL=1
MRGTSLSMLAFAALGCSDASLKTFNADPTATTTSHADGTEVYQSAEVVLTGNVSDSDHAEEDLVVTWSIDGTPVCEDLSPDTDGATSCTTEFVIGPRNIVLSVSDPGDATGTDAISVTVIASDPPDVNLVSPYDGERYRADESIEFKGTVIDNEDGVAIEAWIESSLDGRLDVSVAPDSEGAFSAYGNLSENVFQTGQRKFETDGKQKKNDAHFRHDFDGPCFLHQTQSIGANQSSREQ